ncbi:nucleoside 2-deoxyribosyltransferase [Thermodesulfobacteriota bacterium]
MPEKKARVYCSGPLFNEKEREEMQEIADALEKAGFETFLPHRDGLEFTPLAQVLEGMGVGHEDALRLWDHAIFALDVYQVTRGCDAVIVNLNGRVPDEGAVVEAALAWSADRVVVGYKSDLRTLCFGNDNAMVTGLFDFQLCGGISPAAAAVKDALGDNPTVAGPSPAPGSGMAETLALGKKLWEVMQQSGDLTEVAEVLKEQKG